MRNQLYHILFGVSLLTLIALAVWWIVLHSSQVDSVFKGQYSTLKLEARDNADTLGKLSRTGEVPALGKDSTFRIIKTPDLIDRDINVLYPNWQEYSLIIKPESIEKMNEKHNRRRLMIYGEGTLLMVLVFICVIMLYRLLLAEQCTRKEMQTFFHVVSHELKTPIAGIKMLLENISSGSIKNEELGRYTSLGLKETSRLQRLVENVLLANRIDHHVFSSRVGEIKLSETIERIVNARNRIFSDSETAFENNCSVDTKVKADVDFLQHVIRNLLDNAYKYSGDNTRVTIRLTEDDEWCKIAVIDNGIGFETCYQDILFKKFYRLPDVESRQIKGSGLGLYIAKTLVEAVGGKLEAKSYGKDKGSCFTVSLKRVLENE